jgi:RNA polymerase sigma-54 factor
MIALAWDDFIHQRNDRLACALDITVEMVEEARSFIRAHLHPYPLQLVVDSADDAVILTNPDLIVHRLTNPGTGRVGFTIEIPAAEQFELRLSDHLEYVPQPITAEDRVESSRFEKLDRAIERARTFIDALNYRWHTLQLIGDFLASYQAEFFEHGPRCLKPLTRADLAVALSVHESTISRAISDKTIQLSDGRLMPLSGLFDASLAPKEAIRHILASANHMLSDREISSCLHDQGIFLARRTVAKYRRQIGLSKRNRSQSLTASTARRPR